jgi:hypothetical protein
MGDERKGYTFTDKRGEEKHGNAQKQDTSRLQTDRREDSCERGGPPEIDFSTLIMSFASAAMIGIGKVPDPVSGQMNKNLALAKQNIDIICLLQEKTKGNLSTDEVNLMESILYELRISYIESMKGEK